MNMEELKKRIESLEIAVLALRNHIARVDIKASVKDKEIEDTIKRLVYMEQKTATEWINAMFNREFDSRVKAEVELLNKKCDVFIRKLIEDDREIAKNKFEKMYLVETRRLKRLITNLKNRIINKIEKTEESNETKQ